MASCIVKGAGHENSTSVYRSTHVAGQSHGINPAFTEKNQAELGPRLYGRASHAGRKRFDGLKGIPDFTWRIRTMPPGALLLVYSPPLLDILSMHIISWPRPLRCSWPAAGAAS
jgi:hypothetical protein